MFQQSTTICLYPSTLIRLYPSYHTILAGTVPDVHCSLFCVSLALASFWKEASHKQHRLHYSKYRITSLTMERLFSPCTRYRDIAEAQGLLRDHDFEGLQELILNVSTPELLSAKRERAFTYADMYAMIENGHRIAWLTAHAAVVRVGDAHGRSVYNWEELDALDCFCFNVDGKEVVALARSSEALSEICNVVLLLLAASVVHLVVLERWMSLHGAAIDATSLAYLMEQCQSLKVLSLRDLDMTEDHCRVLGAYSRPDLDIELVECRITGASAAVLAQVLGRNQGPTKLYCCEIDNSVLADVLRGNSRLKRLRPRIFNSPETGNRDVLAIAGALRENKGLVELVLRHAFTMSDEAWDAVCDSLKTQPTLEVLHLQQLPDRFAEPPLAPAVLKSRIQALVDMLKVNTSIHTVRLPDLYFSEHEIYRRSSFLNLRRIASVPSEKLSQLLTVPRCWDERLLLYEPIPIAFG
jgi:hypothetical protein